MRNGDGRLGRLVLRVPTNNVSMNQTKDSAGNLIIVSNRGPNDFVWQDDHWVVRPASGGLVSMIDPLARQPDVTWFCCVSEAPPASESRAALFTTAADQTDPEHHIVPVPLPSKIYQAYYGTISNEVLWMLQHHLVGQFGYSALDAERHRAWTDGYLEANRRIARAIRESGIKPRVFLIQDYHLYPLPALLREVFPDVPSLHFTHIPFPGFTMLKLIPQSWRDTILQGLLGADVVGKQTIVRVDRLDPSKNQIIGFRAFGRLLELRPDLCRNVRFLAFLIPSRTDLRVYRNYRDAVYTMIDEVNTRFAADCEGEPIQVFYTNDREQALAAMEQCDVLLVNSREDGMNLVVKEWAVVSQRPGVAVISETAGVAATTADSALLVSPLDIEGTARAMERALGMRSEERAARLTTLRESVYSWSAADWLSAQLAELDVTRDD